jgi:hypothetical protein
MTLPKWKVALFKRESGIQLEEVIQALWQLPTTEVIESPAPSFCPVESNDARRGQTDPASAEDCNYLGEGSRVSGKLSSQGPARIDGEFEGEITATDSVTLGENAVVTAKIQAASIIVAGTFDGEMIASDSIEIRPSAKVSGNLTQGQQGHLVDAQADSRSDTASARSGGSSPFHTGSNSGRLALFEFACNGFFRSAIFVMHRTKPGGCRCRFAASVM